MISSGWICIYGVWHFFDVHGQSACGRWGRKIIGDGVERKKPADAPSGSLPVCGDCND